MAMMIAAYFIGSIDFGVIVPRLLGVDIYTQGSGNPGASNVLRSMGRKVAAVVVIGDAAKGFLAAMMGGLVVGGSVAFACAFFAVVGHCFPVWHRFKGGKGVATGGGSTYWLAPWLGLILLPVWPLIVWVTKKASIASLVAAVAYVPGLVIYGIRGWSLGWAIAMVLLILSRHHANIRRLLSGSEHAIEKQ